MQITPNGMFYYLIVLLIIGNVFALGIGVLMLAAPRQLKAVSRFSNRWISTRKMTKPLAKSRPTEHAMLRYPRALGAIMLASATLILIKGTIFVTGMGVAEGGRLLARLYDDADVSSGLWESLWISLIAFIALGAVTAVVVGLMSLFRPGQLKRWAGSVNRWVSTRKLTKPLDIPRYHLDDLVAARPRLWGGVITALSLFSAVVLWWFVLGG
jgi:hypothetical protein